MGSDMSSQVSLTRYTWMHMSRCPNPTLCWASRARATLVMIWPSFADVLLVNQTPSMLQNLYLDSDFAMLGDLKLVELPGVYTIAPHGFQTIKVMIKVLSFLAICIGLFDKNRHHLWQHLVGRICHVRGRLGVILNAFHIDIIDYIKPAYCNEAQVSTFLHPSSRFFLLQMLSFRVCRPSSNGKIGWTLPHPSHQSHRIYTLFRIFYFA